MNTYEIVQQATSSLWPYADLGHLTASQTYSRDSHNETVILAAITEALAPIEQERKEYDLRLSELKGRLNLALSDNERINTINTTVERERDELRKMVSEFNHQHEAIIDGIRQAKEGQHQATLLAAEKQSRITALESSAAKVRESALREMLAIALELNDGHPWPISRLIESLITTPASNATDGNSILQLKLNDSEDELILTYNGNKVSEFPDGKNPEFIKRFKLSCHTGFDDEFRSLLKFWSEKVLAVSQSSNATAGVKAVKTVCSRCGTIHKPGENTLCPR